MQHMHDLLLLNFCPHTLCQRVWPQFCTSWKWHKPVWACPFSYVHTLVLVSSFNLVGGRKVSYSFIYVTSSFVLWFTGVTGKLGRKEYCRSVVSMLHQEKLNKEKKDGESKNLFSVSCCLTWGGGLNCPEKILRGQDFMEKMTISSILIQKKPHF